MNHLYFDDHEFPDLGFMPVTDNTEILCPYCSEPQNINIELTLAHQSYIEDCQVCCEPIVFDIDVDFETEQVQIHAKRENE